MSQQYRLARGGKGRVQQRIGTNNEDNKQKFNNLRKNHQIHGFNIKIIGNKNKPTQILTARKAQDVQSMSRAEKIRKNLEHMQQVAKKKKEAQDAYYNKGRSPMLKNKSNPNLQNRKNQNQNPNQQQKNRKQINRNQNQRNFNRNNATSSSSIQQRLNINKQFIPNTKIAKLNRIQNYNKKLQINRGNNQQGNQQNIRRNQNQNKNTGNAIRAVNPRTGEVKYLRPKKRNNINVNQNSKPQNFTVSVGNFDGKQHNSFQKHHVTSELNPEIQNQIRYIQSGAYVQTPNDTFNTQVNSFIPLTPEARVPISTTRTTLHERFSRI